LLVDQGGGQARPACYAAIGGDQGGGKPGPYPVRRPATAEERVAGVS